MDRRKMLALLGVSPALVAGPPAYGRTLPRAIDGDSSVGSSDELITVMNPAIANKLAPRVPLAPRLKDLNNKLIYMINLSWEGPDAANYFYGAMTDWLQKHYTGVRTVVRVTAEGMFGTDPSIIKAIKENHANAVIIGVAG
jgi:hypothetical protein